MGHAKEKRNDRNIRNFIFSYQIYASSIELINSLQKIYEFYELSHYQVNSAPMRLKVQYLIEKWVKLSRKEIIGNRQVLEKILLAVENIITSSKTKESLKKKLQ